MEPISADFEKELAALRDKLEEAEDVRRAITRGEVDAFVVGPGGSGRVLLLANAYQRYRQLVERMSQGAVTATANGHILFANQRFSEMLGISMSRLFAAPLEHPPEWSGADQIGDSVAVGERVWRLGTR